MLRIYIFEVYDPFFNYVWVIGSFFWLNNEEARQWNSYLNYGPCKSGGEHPWVCEDVEHS